MPHLRMRAMPPEHVQTLSKDLLPALAAAINTDEANFTFERVHTDFSFAGKAVSSFPIIEVLWLPRSQEVQDEVAKIITDKAKALIADDVIVMFTKLEKEAYYENGAHF